jgi:hypothetical protein
LGRRRRTSSSLKPLWAVKAISRSQWNGRFGTDSGPSRGDPCGSAMRRGCAKTRRENDYSRAAQEGFTSSLALRGHRPRKLGCPGPFLSFHTACAQLRRPPPWAARSAQRPSAPFDRSRPTSAQGQAEERARSETAATMVAAPEQARFLAVQVGRYVAPKRHCPQRAGWGLSDQTTFRSQSPVDIVVS